jgi:hypothetical protein
MTLRIDRTDILRAGRQDAGVGSMSQPPSGARHSAWRVRGCVNSSEKSGTSTENRGWFNLWARPYRR